MDASALQIDSFDDCFDMFFKKKRKTLKKAII